MCGCLWRSEICLWGSDLFLTMWVQGIMVAEYLHLLSLPWRLFSAQRCVRLYCFYFLSVWSLFGVEGRCSPCRLLICDPLPSSVLWIPCIWVSSLYQLRLRGLVTLMSPLESLDSSIAGFFASQWGLLLPLYLEERGRRSPPHHHSASMPGDPGVCRERVLSTWWDRVHHERPSCPWFFTLLSWESQLQERHLPAAGGHWFTLFSASAFHKFINNIFLKSMCQEGVELEMMGSMSN